MLLIRGAAAMVVALALTACDVNSEYCPCPELPECGGARPDCRDAKGDGGTTTDAPRDVGIDGPDAPIDAGPNDPGWVALPDLPAGCVIEQASHPERLPGLEWEPCGEGCSRGDVAVGFWVPTVAFHDAGRGVVSLGYGAPDGTLLTQIVPVDGPTAAAWRHRDASMAPRCDVRWAAVAEGNYVVLAHYVADRDLTVVEERLVWGSLAAGPAETVATLRPPRVGNARTVDAISVSSQLVVAQITGGAVVHGRAGAVTDVFPATASSGGYYASASDDHVVFAETIGEWRLMHWTPETGTEPYFDPPEAVERPMLEGGTLVWIRGVDLVGGVPTRAELWTSPFVRDPADLAPRLVHPRVEPVEAHFADGTYGWMVGTGLGAVVRLVDVATGMETELTPPPGFACQNQGMYVSRTEVMMMCWEPPSMDTALYRFETSVFARPI